MFNKKVLRILFVIFFFYLLTTVAFSQYSNIIDSFGDHKLPGWYSGGNLTMKYSHSTDNLENGYAEIFSNTSNVTPKSYVGLIRKDVKIQFAQDNILSLMLQGTGNDASATFQILFDKNNDSKYDESTDARFESKPISMNFSGWKEIHININEEEFKVVSKSKTDDFSLLENEAIGVQLSFTTGSDFPTSKFSSGIALVAERPNKEVKQDISSSDANSTESYFSLKNYPNPFNPETNISYVLKSATNVKITVYDRLGREVGILFDGQQTEGEHSIVFNGANLTSGIYFYRIKTSEKTEVRKMVLAK